MPSSSFATGSRSRAGGPLRDAPAGLATISKQLVDNGIFRPFAMVDGRPVAIWRLAGGKLTIEHLAEVSKKDAAAFEADAARVLEFLGA